MGSKESDKSLLKIFALFLIGIYQKISKYTPATCRFYPTCSEYTRQAIVKYGFWKGCFLGMKQQMLHEIFRLRDIWNSFVSR